MRKSTLAAMLSVGFTTSSHADYKVLSALAPYTPTISAAAHPNPTFVGPTLDSVPSYINDGLELRQAPGSAPIAVPPAEIVAPALPAAPAIPPAAVPADSPPVVEPMPAAAPAIPPAAIPASPPPIIDPLLAPAPAPAVPAAAIPPANEAVPPAPQGATPSPILATATMPSSPLLTGDDFVTVQWVETYIGTLHTWVPQTETFHFKAMSQAPLPGLGSIGMGTLTGKTGQTQTI